MLSRFSVEGFKNFEKRVTIDFTNVRDYRFHPECVTDGLLNTAIIYGKNAVGKSNFGLALFDIVSHLTMKNVTPGLYDYYLNINNKSDSAFFEYEFQFDEDEIVYAYNKNEKNVLSSEFLMINGVVMFHNSGSDIGENNGLIELAPSLNWTLKNEISTLKYFLYNSSLEANHPLSKMRTFVNNMLWYRSLDENRFIGYKENGNDYLSFIFDKNDYISEFNELLKQASINDSVVAKKDTDGETRLYFDTKTPMPFMKVASSGTKALYTFYYWYKTAPNVSFMYIDEFDAFYHYELSETIVSVLEKTSGFQKILTSHNTNLLSNRIMRPDCYFILTQDKLTSLANATERELREGHNLEKLYMSGEFDG
jgi:AAA15 family ATPase/GTPase